MTTRSSPRTANAKGARTRQSIGRARSINPRARPRRRQTVRPRSTAGVPDERAKAADARRPPMQRAGALPPRPDVYLPPLAFGTGPSDYPCPARGGGMLGWKEPCPSPSLGPRYRGGDPEPIRSTAPLSRCRGSASGLPSLLGTRPPLSAQRERRIARRGSGIQSANRVIEHGISRI